MLLLKLIHILRIGLNLLRQPATMRHLAETSHCRCCPSARPLRNRNELHFVQLSTTELKIWWWRPWNHGFNSLWHLRQDNRAGAVRFCAAIWVGMKPKKLFTLAFYSNTYVPGIALLRDADKLQTHPQYVLGSKQKWSDEHQLQKLCNSYLTHITLCKSSCFLALL